VAFLVDSLKMSYQDVYQMPYGRRQRLIEWKVEKIQHENKSRQEAESRSRSRRK
jgi:hypothetical protein